jgi:hypothetical protein
VKKARQSRSIADTVDESEDDRAMMTDQDLAKSKDSLGEDDDIDSDADSFISNSDEYLEAFDKAPVTKRARGRPKKSEKAPQAPNSVIQPMPVESKEAKILKDQKTAISKYIFIHIRILVTSTNLLELIKNYFSKLSSQPEYNPDGNNQLIQSISAFIPPDVIQNEVFPPTPGDIIVDISDNDSELEQTRFQDGFLFSTLYEERFNVFKDNVNHLIDLNEYLNSEKTNETAIQHGSSQPLSYATLKTLLPKGWVHNFAVEMCRFVLSIQHSI